mgnify:CR=1 FL=1
MIQRTIASVPLARGKGSSAALAAWPEGDGQLTSTLPEQIAAKLSQRIIAEDYQPGQRVLEQQIAAEFQVSRGPVREALRILEKDGLVIILPRRGAQVTRLTVTEVRDIFDIRASLLSLATRLVATRHEPKIVAAIQAGAERLLELAEREAGVASYLAVSYRLSLLIAGGCGNRRLSGMLFSLARQTQRYTKLGLSTPERRRQSARNWRLLADAVRRGNSQAAEAMSRRLVMDSRDLAIHLLEQAAAAAPAVMPRRRRVAGNSAA